MLKIGAIDISAESRNRLSARIDQWVRWDLAEEALLPRISLMASSPDEIRFRGEIDICFVGPELLAFDAAQVAVIRKAFSKAALVAVLDARHSGSALVEQLARLGVDDLISDSVSGAEAVRKLVLYASRRPKSIRGRCYIVESAKGGVGVTSFVAGLGEAISETGSMVALVDWDTETQDLTRFLQAKPFVNETLRTLLDTKQPVTDDSLAACAVQVWRDQKQLSIVAPPANGAELGFLEGGFLRAFSHVHEAILGAYDAVVIDTASLPFLTRRMLYQLADCVIVLVSDDPAGAHAACSRIAAVNSAKRNDTRLLIQPVFEQKGCSLSVVEQVARATNLDEKSVIKSVYSFSSAARSWPASGETVYSRCKKLRGSLQITLKTLNLEAVEGESRASKIRQLFVNLISFLRNSLIWLSNRSNRLKVKSKQIDSSGRNKIIDSQSTVEALRNSPQNQDASQSQRLLPEPSLEQFVSRAVIE